LLLLSAGKLQTPFVPNSLGQLHTPSQLYDPRVPELVALLDPDACFPAADFCSTAAAAGAAENNADNFANAVDIDDDGFSSIAALQQLGLRSSADLGTLLLAARYVEKTARDGDEDMAVARGKVCLAR
jgi:sacsin